MKHARWILVLLILSGCSGGMSRQVRDEAIPLRDFSTLRAMPGNYRGNTVILGGEVIETRTTPEGSTILVLERALALDRKPSDYAASGGRFMVRFDRFLDPVQFAPGRQITVAGRVEGTTSEKVGEAPYQYVLLEGREIHLWADRTQYPTGYGYYPYYYYPDPFYYPFPYYRRHHYRAHHH